MKYFYDWYISEPLGYYFRVEGKADRYGMMKYEYPFLQQQNSEQDEIVLGVMTKEKDAVLVRLISDHFNDNVEIGLVSCYF